jgi:hypothetical protein
MFRWLWPSSDQQPAQEEQWIAHREVKEQLAFATKTQTEWEANGYEDFDLDYQTKMQIRM